MPDHDMAILAKSVITPHCNNDEAEWVTFVIPLSSSNVVAPSMRPLEPSCQNTAAVLIIVADMCAYQAKLGRVFSTVLPLPPLCALREAKDQQSVA